ncbi:MAG: hypothetical protein AB1Z23_10840 [Eubacteriales bacterium]
MKKRKIKKRYIIIAFLILTILCAALPPTRSCLIMSIYSSIENSKSVMHENNFKIDIPSNKEWYPFVITFNPINFGVWSKTDADMSIMYNFAKFDLKTMSSEILDPESEKNSTFYGAYALSQQDGFFGFKDGEINMDEIALTFKYDYRLLVLRDIGCDLPFFEVDDFEIENNVEFLEEGGWIKIDAVLKTNSMIHNYKEFHTNYIQYGRPKYTVNEDFPEIDMYGRLYAKAFEEYNCTVIFYVMSPSLDTIENCDRQLLQKSTIETID